jgi:hypothetical protein
MGKAKLIAGWAISGIAVGVMCGVCEVIVGEVLARAREKKVVSEAEVIRDAGNPGT